MGQDVRPGMRMRFIYVRGDERVKAWGMPGDTHVDVGQNILLLKRAADEVLDIVQGENRSDALKWLPQQGVLTECIFWV